MSEYIDIPLNGTILVSRKWKNPNAAGETIEAVFSVFEGVPPEGAPAEDSWWSACVYATGKDGKCRNKYNPLQTEENGILALSSEWFLPPTQENLARLSAEVERQAGLR